MALERTAEAIGLESAAIALCALRRHKAEFGRYPNLLRPRTFNEKVLYRMAFDRRPILISVQDKYAAREYVRQRVGEHVLPTWYWVTKNPADIPFDRLPDRFVVKATHGAGFNYLVPDKARVDWANVMGESALWLNQNYYYHSGNREWAYKHIEPRIIVEEFISDGTGQTPMDYKCYVFGGRVQIIQAETRRFGDLRQDCYARSWEKLDLTGAYKPIGGVPRPKHLDGLIGCAEMLGDGLDFVRVDLYDAEQVYFGEMTIYPAAGVKTFIPEKWDRYFGELWDLTARQARL